MIDDQEARLSRLEARVRQLEPAVVEAQEFGNLALLIAERAIASAATNSADPDAFLVEQHRIARERLAGFTDQLENRNKANRMFAALEAVFLHAAAVVGRKN